MSFAGTSVIFCCGQLITGVLMRATKTVQSAKSFTTGCAIVPADTNHDCLVNFEDFACMADSWQQEQFWPEE